MGRTLLRGRLRRRARRIGECPRCGQPIEGATDCWLDAERMMTEHLQGCVVAVVAHFEAPEPRPRPVLRLA